MQITIELPDTLTSYFQAQMTAGHYPTPSDYIQALIQQDQVRQTQLENRLLAALESPASPMTTDDWDHIRATVRQNLSSGQSNA
jgi:antitoxin ParD1/3/4